MKHLTDKEILEACAKACGLTGMGLCYDTATRSMTDYEGFCFDPLTDDGDCARMENKCGVTVECKVGRAHFKYSRKFESFTPGNDAERRRASCLAVARAQLASPYMDGYEAAKEEYRPQIIAAEAELAATEQRLSVIEDEKRNPWKRAIIEGLIVNHILNAAHEADPIKALAALVDWECKIALDPAVSKEAQGRTSKRAMSR